MIAGLLSAADDGTGFGTLWGTLLIVLLIGATILIFRMLSGSLKRMNANVREHPENFGRDEDDQPQ